MAGLLYGVWFVFTARQLRLTIQPEPDRVTIQGAFLTPRLKGYYLLRPGTYRLTADKEGYEPLSTHIAIGAQARQTVALSMVKLPGRLTITTHVADQPASVVSAARIRIDQDVVGETPLNDLEVAAGAHQLQIEAPLYRPFEAMIEVEGMGRRQALTIGLIPDYADVTVTSIPAQAHPPSSCCDTTSEPTRPSAFSDSSFHSGDLSDPRPCRYFITETTPKRSLAVSACVGRDTKLAEPRIIAALGQPPRTARAGTGAHRRPTGLRNNR